MTFIYKPFYWGYRIAGSAWQWSRRRFTRAGLGVAAGCLAAGATGLDIENTVNYQGFALLLAFLAFAVASSFFPREVFRRADPAAQRHRRPAVALPCAGKKSDG